MQQSIEENGKRLEKVYAQENASILQLETLFSELSNKYGMDYKNLLQLLEKRENYIGIPATIFKNALCPLENVSLYLEVAHNFTPTQIATMLKRDHTTIWTTLENAHKKVKQATYKEFLHHSDKTILIPIQLFADRHLSILENVAVYLKDKYTMNYHEIAILLGKNDRTIWTVVNRAKKKLQ